MKKNLIYSVFILSICVLVSCFPDSKNRTLNTDSELKKVSNSVLDCDTLPTIKFSKIYIADSTDLLRIRSEYNYEVGTSPEHKAFVTLNRKEFRFVRLKDTILIPERISDKITDYSIFPPCYPAGKDIPKIIFVSNKYQAYACYESGKLVRFAAANTGKERTQTYPGRYSINWRKALHHSSLDSNWVMPYTINFHYEAGNAFHQFTMPGRPVSHSCVRQFPSDAKWLFSWVDRPKMDSVSNTRIKGTPVIILDAFDFSRKRYGPWMDLASNKSDVVKLPDSPMDYEEALIPISQIPHGARGRLKDIQKFEAAEQVLRDRGIIRPKVVLIETKNFNEIRRKRELEKLNKVDTTKQM